MCSLKVISVIQERNYPSVNRPKLVCVLHTIFKLDFENYINFYVNYFIKKPFQYFRMLSIWIYHMCSIHICIWTLPKWFYLWHCPVCMEILIIHIVWIIDVYTHVKIFTLVLQVTDSMMLLVHIFHIYCNICTRHICDIYVHICNIYVTDIYVTYMSVTHIITICLLPHLHLKYKYVTYI